MQFERNQEQTNEQSGKICLLPLLIVNFNIVNPLLVLYTRSLLPSNYGVGQISRCVVTCVLSRVSPRL